MKAIKNPNHISLLYWLLVLAIGFRSLVVPGLTPVKDEDTPFGFSITFCETLFQSPATSSTDNHGNGHDHSHQHGHDTAVEEPGSVSTSTHCSVAFMGGIFDKVQTFDASSHIALLTDEFVNYYTSPHHRITRYCYQLSRAPPQSLVV